MRKRSRKAATTIPAERLAALYREQLLEACASRKVWGGRAAANRLLAAGVAGYGTTRIATPAEETTIWSDPHLGHPGILRHGKRPWWFVTNMTRALLETWEKANGPGTTLICCGDICGPIRLENEVAERVRSIEGRKVLVAGNHDLGPFGAEAREAVDEVWGAMAIDTDPPLLLTHAPLDKVPRDHVNVHGHLHDQWYLPVTRHINATVEQLDYRPATLDELVGLAKELAAGTIPRGRRTRTRIEWACSRQGIATRG